MARRASWRSRRRAPRLMLLRTPARCRYARERRPKRLNASHSDAVRRCRCPMLICASRRGGRSRLEPACQAGCRGKTARVAPRRPRPERVRRGRVFLVLAPRAVVRCAAGCLSGRAQFRCAVRPRAAAGAGAVRVGGHEEVEPLFDGPGAVQTGVRWSGSLPAWSPAAGKLASADGDDPVTVRPGAVTRPLSPSLGWPGCRGRRLPASLGTRAALGVVTGTCWLPCRWGGACCEDDG